MAEFTSLVARFENAFEEHRDRLAMRWRERESEVFFEMGYDEMERKIRQLAVGLLSLGVKNKEHIALVADVAQLWPIANLGIKFAGGVDVPRGTDSTKEDLAYIISHSGARLVFVHYPAEIDKIQKGLRKYKWKVKQYIVMNNHVPRKHKQRAVAMRDLMYKGAQLISKKSKKVDEIGRRRDLVKPDDFVTIVYTSGTTGLPKGVMLTEENFQYQFELTPELLQMTPEDRGLNLLPPWHIFGRVVEYNLFVSGASITYTDIRHLGHDLREIRPTFLPAVPRIWEGIYKNVFSVLKDAGKEDIFERFKKFSIRYFLAKNAFAGKEREFIKRSAIGELWHRLKCLAIMIALFVPKKIGDLLVFRKIIDATGGEIKTSVAGGAALPGYIDEFFASVDVPVFEGYGLTETAGILSVRRVDRRVPGTVGPMVRDVEYKLIDEDGKDVTDIPDEKGTLHVRGPMIMKGYYKNPEKTNEVLDNEGWFNTGDVVKFTVGGDLCIVGRSKDTVVLLGGENVEPTPIEEKLKESDYIEHVMVVGQDEKFLGALIVPNERELADFVRGIGVRSSSLATWIEDERVQTLFKDEIGSSISRDNGFKSFEKVLAFRLLTKAFEKGDELNNTMKVRRHVVSDRYHGLIAEMYK